MQLPLLLFPTRRFSCSSRSWTRAKQSRAASFLPWAPSAAASMHTSSRSHCQPGSLCLQDHRSLRWCLFQMAPFLRLLSWDKHPAVTSQHNCWLAECFPPSDTEKYTWRRVFKFREGLVTNIYTKPPAFSFSPLSATCLCVSGALHRPSSHTTAPAAHTRPATAKQTFPRSLVTSKEFGRDRNKGELTSARITPRAAPEQTQWAPARDEEAVNQVTASQGSLTSPSVGLPASGGLNPNPNYCHKPISKLPSPLG